MKTTDKINSMTGKYTDAEIAAAVGKSRQYVANYRKRIGEKPLSKWSRFFGFLGVKPDKEIASMMGVTTGAVVRKRLRENIPAVGLSKERQLQESFVLSLSNPKEYVKTPYGIIDILTDDCIYELKTPLNSTAFQQAIGQLLTYSKHYKNKRLVIVTDDIKANDALLKSAKSLGIEILHLSSKI